MAGENSREEFMEAASEPWTQRHVKQFSQKKLFFERKTCLVDFIGCPPVTAAGVDRHPGVVRFLAVQRRKPSKKSGTAEVIYAFVS